MRAVLPILFLAACTSAPSAPERGILAIGDSVMAWNGGAGIPEATAARLGRPVTDVSRSGAHLTHPSAILGALGFDVSKQMRDGDWDWVVLTGGGNDLRGACGTPAEAAILDGIIDADLQGDLPKLIARLRSGGARVAYLGYYDGPAGARTAFTPCEPAFDTIDARMSRLADRNPGVLFFDAGTVIDPADRTLYAGDLIHPSRRGAARIGTALADAMRAAGGRAAR
ncbi:SGNH/GDSL hydrolase family protein [uncultured Jannaschia sp.]|uniref:SGNH/GDSL hydrolase family protein n=1 Tax=uncultured Jannaschia sp. TaxID=293347 RepID=UPI00261C7DBD|nr:SGNH/GDSL hydrolase family protein [uncultured Jannaschia sp.]